MTSRASGQLPTIPLISDQDAPKLHEYLRYTVGYEGVLKYDTLMSDVKGFDKLTNPSIEFGLTDEPVLVLLKMKNTSTKSGDWVFSMGRKSFHDLKMWELNGNQKVLILNNQNLALVKRNTWRYMTLATPLTLEPEEEKVFAIVFEPKNAFHLPLNIRSAENYYHARRMSDAVTFGSITGILILVLVNASFYIFTRMKGFIWLALAEAFYTLQILSSSGYTSYFSGYSNPAQGDLIAVVGKCLFCIFMAKFAQDFISTKKNFPKINRAINILIIVSVLCLMQGVLFHLLIGGPNMLSLSLSWILTLLVSVTLPFVALKATREIDKNFWPLIIAWTTFALFIVYGLSHTLDLVQILPLAPELVGPIGLFEILFASLALSLRVGGIQKQSLENQELLAKSLKDKLELSERSRQLAQDRVNAVNIIQDQNSLIHASGHDSKQVLFALHSAIEMLNSQKETISSLEFKDLLISSASYLEGIVASTLSGAHLGGGTVKFLAFSCVSMEDLLRPLEMIYRKSFQRKKLSFEFHLSEDIHLITDRALLTRAISNLLSNSLKFTDEGGITVRSYVDGQNAIIEIIDSGTGIKPEMRKRLNSGDENRCKQNDADIGSGSGFMFSKTTVQLLMGDLIILPEVTKGTVLRLTLPCTRISGDGCTIKDLQQKLGDYLLFDADRSGQDFTGNNRSTTRIAVTYDDTTIARQKFSEDYAMALYKPLCIEVAEHPIWQSISNQTKLSGFD